MTKYVTAATVFLVLGVALVAGGAASNQPGWQVVGFVLLMFVPALIVDGIRRP